MDDGEEKPEEISQRFEPRDRDCTKQGGAERQTGD